jgi:seryl-tRNA synthetase
LKYYHPCNRIPEVTEETNHQDVIENYFQFKRPPTHQQVASYGQLTEEFGIADLTRGQKVSGHRGYFLCHNGVKLALALAQYGLHFLEERGFSWYQTPALIL